MAKVAQMKDFGVPVPAASPTFDPANPAGAHLIVYYGPKGFTPSYSQKARIDAGPVSGLSTKVVNGITYWDDPIGAELPGGIGNGDYDFVFTVMFADGAEGDFSPPITATVDTIVPPTLGQPVLLG